LTLDIETAPAEMWGWGMFKQNFGVEQVKEHPYILMVGYKWLNERAECLTNWDMSQEEMLLRTTELLREADAIITKNGTRFDVAWIRTELLKHKLPPLPNVTHIDLEKAARAYFRFHSNKLEYILKYLGIGQKVQHEGFGLWRKVMEGNEAARRKMVHYCKGDLIGTEKLYKEMRPHILNHPAIRAIGTTGCPKCGSKHTKKDGFRYTACYQVQQHQCNACHGYFSGKKVKVA
jgi:DNA polymerase elongation subunit (family B)